MRDEQYGARLVNDKHTLPRKTGRLVIKRDPIALQKLRRYVPVWA